MSIAPIWARLGASQGLGGGGCYWGGGGSLEAPAVGTQPSPRAQLPSMRLLFVMINIAMRVTVMVMVITMMRFAVKMTLMIDMTIAKMIAGNSHDC